MGAVRTIHAMGPAHHPDVFKLARIEMTQIARTHKPGRTLVVLLVFVALLIWVGDNLEAGRADVGRLYVATFLAISMIGVLYSRLFGGGRAELLNCFLGPGCFREILIAKHLSTLAVATTILVLVIGAGIAAFRPAAAEVVDAGLLYATAAVVMIHGGTWLSMQFPEGTEGDRSALFLFGYSLLLGAACAPSVILGLVSRSPFLPLLFIGLGTASWYFLLLPVAARHFATRTHQMLGAYE